MNLSLRLFAVVSAASMAGGLPAQSSPKTSPPTKPALRQIKGLGQRERLARPVSGSFAARGPVGPLTALEVERNGSIGFTDAFGANVDYDGDISVQGDGDVVRYSLATSSVVTFDVSAVGASPIADATLLIRDARGQFVAFNDDRGGGSLMPLITVPLPAGNYYATVQGYAGTNTGTYRLSTSAVPTTFAAAALNGPTSSTVPPGGEIAFRVSAPADLTFRMTVSANGGQDLYCALLRPSGAVQRLVDDGVTGTLDPSLDTRLPGNTSGDYILVFGDLNGAGGPFTFNLVTAQQAVPSVPCGSSANGSVAGAEGQAMFAWTLGSSSATTLSVSGVTMTDSWLTLYDANLNTVVYNDDAGSLFSIINVGLPAGTYYLGVESYSNASAGSFTLNVGCTSGFAPGAGRFGDNAGSIATTGDTAVFAVAPGTPIPMEVSVASPALFPMAAILDSNGRCVSFTDIADLEVTGDAVGSGTHYVLVRDYFGATGAFNALLGGPAYFLGTTKGTLTMQDKAGRIHFPFAAVSLLPGGFPVPTPFTGSLLILPPLIEIPALPIPASGSIAYPFNFPNGPYHVQALSLVPVPLGGSMTNVAN